MLRQISLLVFFAGPGYFSLTLLGQSLMALDVEPAEPGREAAILREYFSLETQIRFGKAPSERSERDLLEDVRQPRLRLAEVMSKFGSPNLVTQKDLTPLGIPERVRIHYYGDLGLATPDSRFDDEIHWIFRH